MYSQGIDIQSQKTNEQLDDEEDERADVQMCNWDLDHQPFKPLLKKTITLQLDITKIKPMKMKSNTPIADSQFKVCNQTFYEDITSTEKLNINDSIASNKSDDELDEQVNLCLIDTNAAVFELDFSEAGEDESMNCDIVADITGGDQAEEQIFDQNISFLSYNQSYQNDATKNSYSQHNPFITMNKSFSNVS